MVTLDEMKKYLRVDFEDDDALISYLIKDAENRVKDILRVERNIDSDVAESISCYDLSVMYCVCYLYEHREDADFKELNLGLRALLFGDREVAF